MGKMTVLMLNYEFPPLGGGAGNANYYILKELSRYPDLEIDLVTSSAGKFRYEQFSDNIKVYFLDINKKETGLHYQTNRDLIVYAWKAYRYARKLKKKKRYDLCHAFFGIPCGYLAMKLALPYIVSLRGSDVPFYNRRFYWLDKFILRGLSKKVWSKAKKVIANSEGLKELALVACPNQEVSVIFNGVALEEFCPENTNSRKASGAVKLISVGRLIERKGYHYLIKALQNIKNAELLLIGEGNLKEELEGLAINLGVRVNFLGKVNHECIPGHLRKADIFVLPSLNEGMSNAIIEAMACGLPVIATDTGGSKELIRGNGFMVKKGDISDLKRAIERFIDNPELIEIMGKISKERAEKMGWSEVAANYHAVYLESI